MPRKRTKEELVTLLETKKHSGITINPELIEYVNDKTRIKVICNVHGVIEMTPKSLLNGHGCHKCSQTIKANNQTTNSEEKVTTYIKNKFPNVIIPDGGIKYVNNHESIELICPNHGLFLTTFNRLQNNSCACIKCSYEHRMDNRRKKLEEFRKELELKNPTIFLCENSEYINNKTPIIVRCEKHGEFSMPPQDLLNGHGCPVCGEQFASHERALLESIRNKYSNVEIIHRYKNKEILGKKEIDIYIPKYKIGIEYQGIEHFKPVKHFGGEKKFNELIKRDKEKINECKNAGISLFHFSYSNKNKYIHEKNELIHYNLICTENELFDKIDKLITSLIKQTM